MPITLTNSDVTNNNLFLYKGTQFYKSTTKPGELQTSKVSLNRPQMMTGSRSQAENFKGNVFYGCKTGKFYTVSGQYHDKDTYYNQDLQKKLSPLCQSNSQTPQGGYTIQNPHSLNKGAIKIAKGDVATKSGENVVIKRGNTIVTSLDCKSGKFNTRIGVVDADGGTFLRDTLMKKFCGKTLPATNTQTVGGKVGGKVVIPKDIDLSQMVQNLPPEIKTMITPQTIDGQPNTQGQPDFNQLLTQLQGLS
jgi:hypothetical protein